MHWCDVKWEARGQGGSFAAIGVLWLQCVLLLFDTCVRTFAGA